jgi:cell division protein FtsL
LKLGKVFRNHLLSKKALALVLFLCCIPSALTALVFQIAFMQNSTQNATSLHYKRLIESQTWIEDYGKVRAYVGSDCVSFLGFV